MPVKDHRQATALGPRLTLPRRSRRVWLMVGAIGLVSACTTAHDSGPQPTGRPTGSVTSSSSTPPSPSLTVSPSGSFTPSPRGETTVAPVSLPELARTDKRILAENVLTFTDAVQLSPCSRAAGISAGLRPWEVKAVYFNCTSGSDSGLSPARLFPDDASAQEILSAALAGPTAADDARGFPGGPGWPDVPVPVEVAVVGDVAIVDFLAPLSSFVTDYQYGNQFLWANAASATGHKKVSLLMLHKPLCLEWQGC